MLKTQELKDLADRIIAAVPAVVEKYIVTDDQDFATKRREFNTLENEVNLVIVRPSSTLRGPNLDALRSHNNLTIMILQPYDPGLGPEEEDRQLDLAIEVADAINKLVIKWEGGLDCPVKGITATGSVQEPLRDYHTTIGATVSYLLRKNV